jgi:hypothetical protein
VDDFSRFILGWGDVKTDMTGGSLEDVVQPAVDFTGMIERYHRILKGGINQVPYDIPSELREAIRNYNRTAREQGHGL